LQTDATSDPPQFFHKALELIAVCVVVNLFCAAFARPASERRACDLLTPTARAVEFSSCGWRFRRPHHSCRELIKQIPEPKPHETNDLLAHIPEKRTPVFANESTTNGASFGSHY
jgi:hypothetical protein